MFAVLLWWYINQFFNSNISIFVRCGALDPSSSLVVRYEVPSFVARPTDDETQFCLFLLWRLELMKVADKRIDLWGLINQKAIFGTGRDTALGSSAIDSNRGLFPFFFLVSRYRRLDSQDLTHVHSFVRKAAYKKIINNNNF